MPTSGAEVTNPSPLLKEVIMSGRELILCLLNGLIVIAEHSSEEE